MDFHSLPSVGPLSKMEKGNDYDYICWRWRKSVKRKLSTF